MWTKEDNTFNDIRKRSVEQWLKDMEDNEDIAVRGGVKVTREYIKYLKNEIEQLEDENNLKNTYLKKAAGERHGKRNSA